jgi:hypothetical protein
MDNRAVARRSGQFGVGLVLGFVLAFTIAVSLIAAIAAVVVIVVVGLLMPRYATLAGGLLGIGGTWLSLDLNSLDSCLRTTDFCGDANFVPSLAVFGGLVVAGAALGLWTLLTGIRQSERP